MVNSYLMKYYLLFLSLSDDETNTIAQNSNMINEDCYCIDISDL